MEKLPVILVLLSFLSSCKMYQSIQNTNCETKYPIVLVHGIAYRDDVKIFKYWNKIPKELEKRGAKVYLSNQNAFDTHNRNAKLIKNRILEILDETNADKVNLIAHSKGGVESRYMISMLDMADKVASLTTIASPHRGSIEADNVLNWAKKNNLTNLINKIVKTYSKIIGDKDPHVIEALEELKIESMKGFNQQVLDAEQVYYQSYIGIVNEEYPSKLQKLKHNIIYKHEGENDGVVSVKSAKWGDFKGIVKNKNGVGVSHFEIVGITNTTDFDHIKFIINIVNDLKKKGF